MSDEHDRPTESRLIKDDAYVARLQMSPEEREFPSISDGGLIEFTDDCDDCPLTKEKLYEALDNLINPLL